MSARSAPEAEPVTVTLQQTTDDAHSTPSSTPSTPLSDIPSPYNHPIGDDDLDELSPFFKHEYLSTTNIGAAETPTTLRPAPLPSIKRRESEASLGTPGTELKKGQKRKRGASPPWQFPTVVTSTIKAADGRRISARFNASTPGQSESEGNANLYSYAAPQVKLGSPPWKRFAADGPSSIEVDGKRKSGRVHKDYTGKENALQRSPHNQKHALVKDVKPTTIGRPRGRPPKHSRPGEYLVSPSASPRTSKPGHARSAYSKVATTEEDDDDDNDAATAAAGSPEAYRSNSRTRRPGRKSFHGHVSDAKSSPTQPKVKLRINFSSSRHQIVPAHPHAIPPLPRRPPQLSLSQIIERYELRELQQPHLENERGPPDEQYFVQRNERQANEEAAIRHRLVQAGQPGGALSRDIAKFYYDEHQNEPTQQYGHYDHLLHHALYFRQLQQREKVHHKSLAKKVAQEAYDFWKARRGPTEEDIRAEEDKMFRLVYKQVITDMRAKWDMVVGHVQQLRKERWEAIEDAKRQERLQKQLEWSEKQIAKQRGELSDSDLDEDSTGNVMEDGSRSDRSDDQDDGNDSSLDENMSVTESENGSQRDDGLEGELAGDDLAAYLEYRKAYPPDKPNGEEEEEETLEETTNNASAESDIASGDENMVHASILLRNGDLDLDSSSDAEDFRSSKADVDGTEDDMDEENSDKEEDDSDHGSQRAMSDVLSLRRGQHSVRECNDMTTNSAEIDLSSDESVEMYDSDEDMSNSDDEQDEDNERDGHSDVSVANSGVEDSDAVPAAADKSLLGFLFSSRELKNIGLPTPTTSAGGDERDHVIEEASHTDHEGGTTSDIPVHGEHTSLDQGLYTDKEDATAAKEERTEIDVDTDTDIALDTGSEHHLEPAKPRVAIPNLLRGTLRSYQHAGLDWLASLYRNGTNGILADEMGLGKTIQTISLLAHLAEHYGVWETHLVIVPTSVILNWVTEFQKFLPGFRVLGYYGNTEERAAKRRSWANDPHHNEKAKRGYNVVITSYNVAMQDINAIRVVQWHYLVLDEAHNIRNFNSQRWQVLIRLRTRARLLLTGTPLQNSLVELWSLLTFLTAGDDDPAHGDLEDFLSHWKEPVKEIFERGVSSLSSEAQRVVDQLHISLRPFLLRRLKSEVEKDLPKKTESVVVCKLSKRQRQLYQEYMGLTATRESLARGNAVSAGRVLLSLRRVCNHPDLFDPRPIQTSFAMGYTAVDQFSSAESVVRKMLGTSQEMPYSILVTRQEYRRKYATKRSRQLSATRMLQKQIEAIEKSPIPNPDPATPSGCQVLQKLYHRNVKLEKLRNSISTTTRALNESPLYGTDLRELLTIHKIDPYCITRSAKPGPLRFWRGNLPFSRRPIQVDHLADWYIAQDTTFQKSIPSLDQYAARLEDTITRFAFCTPAVTAPILDYAIPHSIQRALREDPSYPKEIDYAHEARARTSIVFPDKRLLVYDSGKLQRLTLLLRELQARRSRSLIFTQMTGTLNILEQFLSLMNLPYLRLDGSTPVERRQLYAAEFNRPNSRYQCMILSSRAGGVGLNLTGASSVIFFDLDWNPQMDRQCMDRAHRIGQVRDVEVYKMVSEKTVEENILRRANQKSLLDQTVIQEGHFTTEYHQPLRPTGEEEENSDDEDVAAAIERFLGGGEKASNQALESVEDREDVQAAQQARKEENQDEADFADRSSKGPSAAATPGPGGQGMDHAGRDGHVDFFMIRTIERALEGVPYVPPVVRRLDKTGRDPSHRPKKRR